ncbi:hypothetical protein BDZ45DRAFT_185508 [Acephala macrosclerotiorum]|nr:hypothetical protein BDZ45DRAFT_185508 [Acephala macrosclerotiorum]
MSCVNAVFSFAVHALRCSSDFDDPYLPALFESSSLSLSCKEGVVVELSIDLFCGEQGQVRHHAAYGRTSSGSYASYKNNHTLPDGTN